MADITPHRNALIDRVLKGAGTAKPEQRRAAYDHNLAALAEPVRGLLDKVARHAYKITDDDIAAAKAAGISEDEIFELAVCAALGQAQRQLDAAYGAIVAAERGLAAPTRGAF